MSRPLREGPDQTARTPRRTWGSAAARQLARTLLFASVVVMASACVVPWSVERDEPPPNSPPIFDGPGITPPLGDVVQLTNDQNYTFIVAARDADLGDELTARLFTTRGNNRYVYTAQEFRLSLPAIPDPLFPQRRIGQPLTQVNYCALYGPGTIRVLVTDGTFLNIPDRQHEVTGGDVIEGTWTIQCN